MRNSFAPSSAARLLHTQKWIGREKGNLSAFVPLLFPSHCCTSCCSPQRQLVKWISRGFSVTQAHSGSILHLSARAIQDSCSPDIGGCAAAVAPEIHQHEGQGGSLGGEGHHLRHLLSPNVVRKKAARYSGGWRLLSVGLTVVGGVG